MKTMLCALLVVASAMAACERSNKAKPPKPCHGHNPACTPIAPPTPLPGLLTEANVIYQGAFRLPRDSSNDDNFSFGGGPLAYNNNSLFAGTYDSNVAEISIPPPVISQDVNALPFATYIQGFADPTEGQLSSIGWGAGLSGLLVSDGKLFGTGAMFYDANNEQTVSHFSRALSLSTPSATPFQSVYPQTGFVSGYLASIPSTWQSTFEGTAITGQCCIPIVSRTSMGPSAFSWTPTQLGAWQAIPIQYYDGTHPTLGMWPTQGPYYGGAMSVGGMVLEGDSALVFGMNGTTPYCYGEGTGDPAIAGTIASDGALWCLDPVDSSKGGHAYPYIYQVWAYSLHDWAAVMAGTKQPWEAIPYNVWTLSLLPLQKGLQGLAYDRSTHTLYVNQRQADQDGYAYRGVIHVFSIR